MTRLREKQNEVSTRSGPVSEARASPRPGFRPLTTGFLTRAALPSIAAISIALLQATTTMARSRIDDPSKTSLVLLSEIQVTDTDSGSQITIAADDALGEISTRVIGTWFEIRIRHADTSRTQRNFAGRGFDLGHVVQSGSVAVFLFRLRRGATARAVPESNSVRVIVSLATPPGWNWSNTSLRDQSLSSPANLLLPLRSGSRRGEVESASRPESIRAVNLNDLPPLSRKITITETAPIIPVSNFVSMPVPKVVISDQPPPPAQIANSRLPPALRKLDLTQESVVPALNFSKTLPLVGPLQLVISKEPPSPPNVATKTPPLPSRRPNVSLTSSAPIPIVLDAGIFAASSVVPITDDSPPPPAPIKVASDKAPVLKSSVTPDRMTEEANKPVEKTESESELATPAPVDTGAVTESESAKVVDPTKPAPAQINLPKGPLPQPRGRAPLSSEKRFELSGVISIDYSKTNQSTTPDRAGFGNAIKNRGRNLGLGLDMHLGTFVIDPRFLKLSFDTGFTTNRGAFDEFSTRQGNKGAAFYLDFLPTSPYPFRFHFTRQNTNFLETQISSASTGRRSLGFDWSLRKPRWPNLSVNFEDTSYASRFVASSAFKSQSGTLSLSLTDNVKGWDVNSNFSKQSATEGITNLKTDLNFLRFDARRQLSKKSNLFVTSFFEKLHFNNPRTRLAQEFSFFDIHSDFSLQQTKKLSFRASHQFYYSSNDQVAMPSDPGAHEQRITPDQPPPRSVTSFNSAQGQINYRVFPALNFSGSASARFIATPESTSETAARFLDFTASIAWNKRLGFAETRASFVEGITHVRSSFGQSRGVEFRSYSAGISMGRISRALVTADFSSTTRPDAFQIGGSFSQKYFNVAVETHAVSRFRIRASVGENLLDYATASGSEHLKTATYSLSVDDKWFTVLLNHNSNSGVRDVFLAPITLDNTRIFRVLPIDSLVRDPLLNGSAVFTLGLVRFKPRNGLDLEIRYLRDKVLFARTNNVFTEQFDVLARYKLGKITLTGGFIVFQQDTEDLFRRGRKYFVFRLSRPFTLF